MRLPWTTTTDGGLSLVVDRSIYPADVLSKTCYLFTGRAYVFLTGCGEDAVRVDLVPKNNVDDLTVLAGEFANALLEETVRMRVAEETRIIRELIVAQAFCEGDLLDRRDIEAEPADDPRGIAIRR